MWQIRYVGSPHLHLFHVHGAQVMIREGALQALFNLVENRLITPLMVTCVPYDLGEALRDLKFDFEK